MAIQNIVFDVGNVLIKWDPISIVQSSFPEIEDPAQFMRQFFKTEIWIDLNLGKISEKEALLKYHQALKIDKSILEKLMHNVRKSLVPMEGSIELVKKLHQLNFKLYIITDNTHEIMQYLKKNYDFWHLFQGIVVSAEIGHLKPSPIIYRHLLNSYELKPEETLFLDDIPANVRGAQAVKMLSIQFTDASKCILDLKTMNIHCD